MDNYDYETSEQAFIDVWKKYGSPRDIIGSSEVYNFLTDLMNATSGLVIVDHFSQGNYDHIYKIELKNDLLYIYWKDFEEDPSEFELIQEAFGNATYIYTLCNLRKLKFLNIEGHLLILFLPNVISLKEAKNILELTRLEDGTQLQIREDYKNFETEFIFIKENKIHICTMANLPFYSFLIQPKENDFNTMISTKVMIVGSLYIVVERLQNVKNILESVSNNDTDEIQSAGNRIRTILESLIKYYCLCMNYTLPNKNSYGDNMLGDLRKHLVNQNDNLSELFTTELIKSANIFSHDSGGVYSKIEALRLYEKVNELTQEIFKRLHE